MTYRYTDASSTNTTHSTLKYRSKSCICGQRAEIRVTQSEKNRGKLYYACAQRTCNFWEWCKPLNSTMQARACRAPESITEGMPSLDLQARMKFIEGNQDNMKLVIVISIIINLFVLFIAIMK